MLSVFSHKFTNTTNTVAKLSLLTLNVNGIKEKLTAMDFGDLCRMYDIVCVSVAKCDDVNTINVIPSMENLGFDIAYKKTDMNIVDINQLV